MNLFYVHKYEYTVLTAMNNVFNSNAQLLQ